jgi:cell wall-associated NlpC family hydrolase
MSAASASVARGGLWRRSLLTFLAAAAAFALVAGTTVLPAMAADPVVRPKPADAKDASDSKKDASEPLTPAQQRVENVIAAARQYLGVPYRVGSEGPNLMDCSGLVFRAFSDAGLVDRVSGARLRAAGYMRWFAARGLMTADESAAQRGDLVIYNNGSHIGIYLGDGRTESALLSGVTVHSLHGISLPVTGFLRPDWSGDGNVPPFVPVTLPDVPEIPATLVPAASWLPAFDPTLTAPAAREGVERVDLRTPNSRTFENADGTFTTEFHAQPIFYAAPDSETLEPIDLHFATDEDSGFAVVSSSPVAATLRPADDEDGFLSIAAGEQSLSLGIAPGDGADQSKSSPTIIDEGRAVDYFDFQPHGVGLRVAATPDGFKAFLVLDKEPDQNRFSFTLNAPGLTPTLLEDGSIALLNADGVSVGRIPQALLLDSSDDEGNGGGVFTAATSLGVDLDGDTPVITVAVERAYLDEAVYPAYVDLSLTGFGGAAADSDIAFASSAHPNASMHGYTRPEAPGFGELWLGRQPNSRTDNEVYVRFNGLASTLGTVDVANASLEMLPYWQAKDGSGAVVRRVAADWAADTLTWELRPATDPTSVTDLSSVAGTWASIDLSGYVADVLSHGAPDFGLALTAADEATATWERLAASDAGDLAEFGPRLVVTWSGLRPSGSPVSDAGFAWSQPQLAGEQTRFQLQFSRDGFATIDFDSGTVKGAAGRTASYALPSGSITTTGAYEWRVRVKYGDDKTWSPWSAAGSYSYTAPAPPAAAAPAADADHAAGPATPAAKPAPAAVAPVVVPHGAL